ncbi:thioredoxin domain-containing protein [Marinilabilia sp.]|uniref:thioredoxin domain-containing protein n=1 Tax=Marinilabilia sp. TaxID=2021252 RepID=UPI0025C01E2E|nr:thioredoxin domain-containing protein [Marinilabilia sp.]
MSINSTTNHLIHSTSPYLLQHAHNPVAWHPWNQETLNKALQEDKPILVSIGYSACHWCHVMAHECFEDKEVSRLMNEHFICIKVDREERPDVDHFFMTALQMMGGQGGWPLNVVALPDGQPFWGGTYLPKDQWMSVLEKIQQLFENEREKLTHHAHNLTTGIQQASLIPTENQEAGDLSDIINEAMETWSPQWDMRLGGSRGKPKFPMPVNLEFLLHQNFHHPQKKFAEFINTSLQQMARGGIYDQAGGGFARYSVDEFWKVPHFEKMLYDNAQLTELYAHAYGFFGNEEYKKVVYETISFVEKELMHPSGAFFSALDADSEGEEGKYYVWSEEELVDTLGKEFPLFADYFNINETGYWENGYYILLRSQSDEEFSRKHQLEILQLQEKRALWKRKLIAQREQRVRPGLDDKSVTSWNALMNKGLAEAYKIFGEDHFRELALKNGHFILNNLKTNDGGIFHTWKNHQPSISGFMEDYAAVIAAFVVLFEISGDELWISEAIALSDYAFEKFYDEEAGHFRFMEKDQKELPANHFETQDNVIPSANAIMGYALAKLHLFTGEKAYQKTAQKMLTTMLPQFRKYPWGFAHWGSLMLFLNKQSFEVVISGPEHQNFLTQLQKNYRPDIIWAPVGPESQEKTEITKGRKSTERNTIFVCKAGACQLPVYNVEEAEKLILIS